MKCFPIITLLLASALGAYGQPTQIHTDRPSPLNLALPDEESSFNFVIFGDRTGGVPEGLRVLEKAVVDANLMAPDLVMTVGDLIQGYTDEATWITQMQEYRGVMKGLKMPWYPVAGNHDIYWRGDGRPLTEHETSYEKHFGPLWYWFEHKGCGFMVLFSDEGDLANPKNSRSFRDPAQQKFSEGQMAWIQRSLNEMKDLKKVFVFMHQPRWDMKRYPGSNWADVHKLLVAHGGVKACFAGHIHRMRYDGEKDGIQLHTLATTGGSSAGNFPDTGFLHHLNLVSVRSSGVHVSSIPISSVRDPRIHTAERSHEVDLARKIKPDVGTGFALDAQGKGSAEYAMKFSNPTSAPLEITLAVNEAKGWEIHPQVVTVTVKPGETQTAKFNVKSDGAGFEGKFRVPTFEMDLCWAEDGKRSQMPGKKFPLETVFKELPEGAFLPTDQSTAIHISDRESGVKVKSSTYHLPDGPFTMECRIKPDHITESSGILAKTQNSEYGFTSNKEQVIFLVHLGGRYIRLKSGPVLKPGQWVHLAAVYDGKEARLYVDGKKVDATAASGSRTLNKLPLFIGADTDKDGQASRSFLGWIDEIRLSKGAIYTDSFIPESFHKITDDTVLMYHADRWIGGRLPDESASKAHASPVGKVSLKPYKN
jgi:hypothetical protein